MTTSKTMAIFILLLGLHAGNTSAREAQMGDIVFPNSGSEAAQGEFLAGVKALHSFQFDEARMAFERAQAIDPSFALAYWGQAMSDNHPLWAEQDMEAASAALIRLAPTYEARLASAASEKEKAYISAIEILYFSPGDKLQRDFAYSEHMSRMHERWPDDDEVAIFYALSILGTVRRGDHGYRRQALAAAISQAVFARNENHPGAAHFTIHSFDDPDHAILALPAATVYAGIAPAAAHALHMPSHIFLQLGQWEDVVASNTEAYAAAFTTNEKFGLAEGRADFHTLSWLAYANLMLGRVDAASENLDLAHAALKRNPGPGRVAIGYLNMRGRHIIETAQWDDFELDDVDSVEGSHANWVAVVGMSAAYRGNADRAQAAMDRLAALAEQADEAGKAYDAKKIAILGKEVEAVLSLSRGEVQRAIDVAHTAADMEVRDMRAPSGPPDPMKPAVELLGDILLATDRPVEAIAAYERSLQWIPKRTPSVEGLAAAAARAGHIEAAGEDISK